MSGCIKVGDTPADIAEGLNAGMLSVGISETGNEVGLDKHALESLPILERAFRGANAEEVLREAGADHVLRTIAHLPALLQCVLQKEYDDAGDDAG